MTNWQDELNSEQFKEDYLQVNKMSFFRPEHPDLKGKLFGWIAQWKLEYKRDARNQFILKTIEEKYNSEELAKKALRKYNINDIKEIAKDILKRKQEGNENEQNIKAYSKK